MRKWTEAFELDYFVHFRDLKIYTGVVTTFLIEMHVVSKSGTNLSSRLVQTRLYYWQSLRAIFLIRREYKACAKQSLAQFKHRPSIDAALVSR